MVLGLILFTHDPSVCVKRLITTLWGNAFLSTVDWTGIYKLSLWSALLLRTTNCFAGKTECGWRVLGILHRSCQMASYLWKDAWDAAVCTDNRPTVWALPNGLLRRTATSNNSLAIDRNKQPSLITTRNTNASIRHSFYRNLKTFKMHSDTTNRKSFCTIFLPSFEASPRWWGIAWDQKSDGLDPSELTTRRIRRQKDVCVWRRQIRQGRFQYEKSEIWAI